MNPISDPNLIAELEKLRSAPLSNDIEEVGSYGDDTEVTDPGLISALEATRAAKNQPPAPMALQGVGAAASRAQAPDLPQPQIDPAQPPPAPDLPQPQIMQPEPGQAPKFTGPQEHIPPQPEEKGLLGDIGRLKPEEREPARLKLIEEAKAAEAAALKGLESAKQRVKNQSHRPAWELNSLNESVKNLQANYDNAVKARQEAETGPAPTQTKARNFADQAGKSFTQTYNSLVESAGVIGGALSKIAPEGSAIASLGGGTKLDDNAAGRAADAIEKEIEKSFPGDPARQNEFASKLGSGTGSVASFLLGGVAAKGAGLSGRAAVAAVGASATGAQGYKEAEAAGASDNAKIATFVLNSGLGISEAIPIGRFFDRLNATTGGKVAAIIKNTGAQSVEEVMQEVGQQVGSNVVAKTYYDHERDILAGVEDSAKVAAVLGGAMGAGAGALAPVKKPQTPAGAAAVPGVPSPEAPPPLNPAELLKGGALPGMPTPEAPPGVTAQEVNPPVPPGVPTPQPAPPVTDGELLHETPPVGPPAVGQQPVLPPEAVAPVPPEFAQPVAPPEAQQPVPAPPVTEAVPPQEGPEVIDADDFVAKNVPPNERKILETIGYDVDDIALMSPAERKAEIEGALSQGIEPELETEQPYVEPQAQPEAPIQPTPAPPPTYVPPTQDAPPQEGVEEAPAPNLIPVEEPSLLSALDRFVAEKRPQSQLVPVTDLPTIEALESARHEQENTAKAISRIADRQEAPHNRPLAVAGLTSYRARSPYGWVMIGAKNIEDALNEARRSTPNPTNLQVWNGQRYTPVEESLSARPDQERGQVDGGFGQPPVGAGGSRFRGPATRLEGGSRGTFDAQSFGSPQAVRQGETGSFQRNQIRGQRGEMRGSGGPLALSPQEDQQLRYSGRTAPGPRFQPSRGLRQTESEQRRIVGKIAGPGVPVRFEDELIAEDSVAKMHGHPGDVGTRLRGLYEREGHSPRGKGITFSREVREGGESDAFHESFHAVEMEGQLTREDRDLIERERPSLQRAAAQYLHGKPDRNLVKDLDPLEITAYAFEAYAKSRYEKGVLPKIADAVKRMFNRLLRLVKVRDKRAVNVFEDVYAGRRAVGESPGETGEGEASRSTGSPMNGAGKILRRSSVSKSAPLPFPTVAQYLDSSGSMLSRVSSRGGFKLRRKFQDRFLAIMKLQQSIEDARGGNFKIPESQRVYEMEERFYGRRGDKLLRFRESHVEPLTKRMAELGISSEELSDYLQNRHAPYRNAMIAARNPKMPDGGSGIKNADAAAYMQKISQSGKKADYESLAARVDRIVEMTRDLQRDSGLISGAQHAEWSKLKHYVPLRGFKDKDMMEDAGNLGPSGFDIDGPESHHALGRESLADNSLLYVLQQHQTAIDRAEKNRVAKSFYLLAKANPSPIWATFPDHRGRRTVTKRRLDTQTNTVREFQDKVGNYRNVIATKIGGEVFYVGIHDSDVFRAVKNMGSSGIPPALRGFHNIAVFYAKMTTQWNPEFVLRNVTRDFETAFVNIGESGAKHARKKLVGYFPLAGKGVFQFQRGNLNSKWAKVADDFSKHGGKINFIPVTQDIDQLQKTLERHLRRNKKGAWGMTKRGMTEVFKLVEDLNTAAENAARVATYQAMVEAGISKTKAASFARNLTVNFDRKGEWGPIINVGYLFFNASTQGSARLVQGLVNSKHVRRAAVGIILAGFALDMLNHMNSGDDEDGKPAYDKISEWEKDHNLIFMMPGDKEGRRIKLPFAYGYNSFLSLGRHISEVMTGRKDPLTAAKDTFVSVINAFNPIGENNPLTFWVPTIAKPLSELGSNKNFMDRPIMPERPFSKDPLSQQSFESVNPIWKKAAETLNEITGGSRHRSGWADISPEQIEHVMEFLGSGVGRFASNAGQTIERLYDGEDWLPEKTPFARVFYGKKSDSIDRNLYHETKDMIEGAHHEWKSFAEDGDKARADEIYKKEKFEIDFYPVIQNVEKESRRISKQINKLKDTKNISDENRDKLIDRLKEQRDKLQSNALKEYYRRKKARDSGK